MKKIILQTTAILLILAGVVACGKENADIDMSKIDFSNIENLYEQPLPVIQKAVQGRWKLYQTCGGDAGCSYPPNTFITIASNEIILENIDSGEYIENSYSWKNKKVDVYGKTINSYVLWPGGADETAQSGMYFLSIKSDTLVSRSCSLTSDYTVFESIHTKVK
ncbi:MAG: hypothetical protein LBP63_05875 [Prevotellaceae bacterium]|nr:hypothetical protein [Prevotellaceae bacterium]